MERLVLKKMVSGQWHSLAGWWCRIVESWMSSSPNSYETPGINSNTLPPPFARRHIPGFIGHNCDNLFLGLWHIASVHGCDLFVSSTTEIFCATTTKTNTSSKNSLLKSRALKLIRDEIKVRKSLHVSFRFIKALHFLPSTTTVSTFLINIE